jgi:hypothetical protein
MSVCGFTSCNFHPSAMADVEDATLSARPSREIHMAAKPAGNSSLSVAPGVSSATAPPDSTIVNTSTSNSSPEPHTDTEGRVQTPPAAHLTETQPDAPLQAAPPISRASSRSIVLQARSVPVAPPQSQAPPSASSLSPPSVANTAHSDSNDTPTNGIEGRLSAAEPNALGPQARSSSPALPASDQSPPAAARRDASPPAPAPALVPAPAPALRARAASSVHVPPRSPRSQFAAIMQRQMPKLQKIFDFYAKVRVVSLCID